MQMSDMDQGVARRKRSRTDGGVRHDHHHVGVLGEKIDERGKLRVAHLQIREVRSEFAVKIGRRVRAIEAPTRWGTRLARTCS